MPSWTLSTVDIEVLAETLALPPLPFPLDVPSPRATSEERRHLDAVRADLADRGLVAGGALGDALVLLACGEFLIDGRLAVGRQLDLVGAVRGERAALAVRSGEAVQVSLVHVGSLTDRIVDLLPSVRQLPGNSTTMPHDALVRALRSITRDGDLREFERILTEAGVRDTDMRLLAELVRDEGATAQFGVAARKSGTDSVPKRRVWTWYASEAGGVLFGFDSPAWTSVVPASPRRVGQFLGRALYELRYGDVRGVRG